VRYAGYGRMGGWAVAGIVLVLGVLCVCRRYGLHMGGDWRTGTGWHATTWRGGRLWDVGRVDLLCGVGVGSLGVGR
jgi:hypothetical protein